MFDWLKKSKREQIKDNARQGKDGEDRIRNDYEWSGYEVKRTGRGHDLKASKRDWLTGKKNTKYIEVKTGNSKLSPLQKKKKRQLGRKYVVERLETTPFGFASPNDSIWGSSSTTKRKSSGTKKKKKARSSKRKKASSISDSIWGSSSASSSFFGGGNSTRKRKTTKRKSSSISDSIWGSSSTTKRKKSGTRKRRRTSSISNSIWGSSSSSRRRRNAGIW